MDGTFVKTVDSNLSGICDTKIYESEFQDLPDIQNMHQTSNVYANYQMTNESEISNAKKPMPPNPYAVKQSSNLFDPDHKFAPQKIDSDLNAGQEYLVGLESIDPTRLEFKNINSGQDFNKK